MQFTKWQYKKWLATIPLTLTILTGCSIAEKLVYRADINQGNYVEQDAVNKLKLGMTKEQVRYVLGSPMLIENGYPNIWHYIYHHTEGHSDSIQKNLVVNFSDNGTLMGLEGDYSVGKHFFEGLN